MIKKNNVIKGLVGLFLAAGLSSPALAGAQPTVYQSQAYAGEDANSGSGFLDKANWDVSLGMGVAHTPKYPGASDDHWVPFPQVSIAYKDTYFLNQRGLGANLYKSGGFKAGVALGLDYGRDQSDSAYLHGMGNIETSANFGAFASYNWGNWAFDGMVRHALTHIGSYGTTADMGANYRLSIVPKKLDVVLGPQVSLADSDYMKTWFGVSRAQSAASGLASYKAEGGVKDVSLNARVNYTCTPHVVVTPFMSAKRLVGDAADSPVVVDKTQYTWGLGAAYHF